MNISARDQVLAKVVTEKSFNEFKRLSLKGDFDEFKENVEEAVNRFIDENIAYEKLAKKRLTMRLARTAFPSGRLQLIYNDLHAAQQNQPMYNKLSNLTLFTHTGKFSDYLYGLLVSLFTKQNLGAFDIREIYAATRIYEPIAGIIFGILNSFSFTRFITTAVQNNPVNYERLTNLIEFIIRSGKSSQQKFIKDVVSFTDPHENAIVKNRKHPEYQLLLNVLSSNAYKFDEDILLNHVGTLFNYDDVSGHYMHTIEDMANHSSFLNTLRNHYIKNTDNLIMEFIDSLKYSSIPRTFVKENN